MGLWATILGFLSVGTVYVTMIGRPRRADRDDTIVAFGLVGVWAVTMIAQVLADGLAPGAEFPPAIYLNPVIDLAFGAWIARLYRRRPRTWKLGVLGLLVFQMIMHVAILTYWAISPRDNLSGALYAYTVALNVSFVAQLACDSTPGVRNALRRRRGSLPRGPRRDSPAMRGDRRS